MQLIQYQEQSDIAFKLLVKSQRLDEPINLEELMCYSLTPVPPSRGTPDGFFSKTNKSKMLQFLMDDTLDNEALPKDAMYIQDGNALFHALVELPPTFGLIALQILDQMVSRKKNIFSTDSYQPDSIKSQERTRRGCSEKLIIQGIATRKPADFKNFLQNEQNKLQLCQMLLKVWGSQQAVSRLKKCESSMIVVEGKVHNQTVDGEKVSLEAYRTFHMVTI